MQRRPRLLEKWIRPSVGNTEILLEISTSCRMKNQRPHSTKQASACFVRVWLSLLEARENNTLSIDVKKLAYVYVNLKVLVSKMTISYSHRR